MPKFHLQVIENQLLADVFVFKNDDEGKPPIAVKVLFDTGATRSCITAGLAKELALVPKSKIPITGVHGVRDCNVYKLKMGLPFPAPNRGMRVEVINEVEVSEIDDNPVWSMIVGMDIIQAGVLVVEGDNYIFSL
ncbi:MAG: hypothetical protein FWF84_00110 [Kiritimatiellaeota bacterium]|nr:hypothetical protein [Kiritimatiellota bacterium]